MIRSCVLSLVFVTSTALAFGGAEPPGPEPGLPDEFARRRALELLRERQVGVQMAVSGGKLYIVTGDTLRKLDAMTLAEEGAVPLPAPAEAERQTVAKEAFLKRFDKNADGFITEDEVERPELLRRFDRDGDGKISISEVPAAGLLPEPPAPVSLLVDGNNIYVFRGGTICRFNAADLSLEAKAELPSHPGERPVIKRKLEETAPGKKKDREKDEDKALKKRAREDRRGPAEPLGPPPEEPVRF